MKHEFALIGNQNCGKTTLFNQLTGTNQHVGNFPGVTVEKKVGAIRGEKEAFVVDLPGIYSLSPYTAEEVVTRNYLIDDKPDAIINIVDATNIERNLYLTLQLIELEMPMVIALNMMDEVRKAGNHIHIKELEELLGVPVVPISAFKNEGIDELIKRAMYVAGAKKVGKKIDFCEGPVHRAIHSVDIMIEDHAEAKGIASRFAATKLIEGDPVMEQNLDLSLNELDILGHVVTEMEAELGTDREAAMADMRYTFIEAVCAKTVHKVGETLEQKRSRKIDAILTHRFFAIPIFIAVMAAVFYLTFGLIGSALSDWLAAGIEYFIASTDAAMTDFGVNPTLQSLVIDGVFTGVGSVLGFLPLIVVLFFFLSVLEDTGYMARVAFVMDKLLRKIGLSGRSFVPMIIGFGCSVPAIMATRTLASERDRHMTIMLTPFMSCSAKVPIYAVFSAAFFPDNAALVMTLLYITGMVVAVIVGLLLKNTVFKGSPVPFVMELPAYRFPSAINVLRQMWDKAKDFIVRAFTIIFVATIIIWFLQTFTTHFALASDSSESLLAAIGSVIAPIFAPLGFGTWQTSTALIAGLTAKEAVVSTFAVLMGVDVAVLPAALAETFSPLAAVSFLVFTLLYMPCVASMAAVKRELESGWKAAAVMAFQTGVAWVVAFLVYNIGGLM